MTRKHFKALAEAIATIKEDSMCEEKERVINLVGRVCHESNGRFDWTRFREACHA